MVLSTEENNFYRKFLTVGEKVEKAFVSCKKSVKSILEIFQDI